MLRIDATDFEDICRDDPHALMDTGVDDSRKAHLMKAVVTTMLRIASTGNHTMNQGNPTAQQFFELNNGR